jgi:hypothetical protein
VRIESSAFKQCNDSDCVTISYQSFQAPAAILRTAKGAQHAKVADKPGGGSYLRYAGRSQFGSLGSDRALSTLRTSNGRSIGKLPNRRAQSAVTIGVAKLVPVSRV